MDTLEMAEFIENGISYLERHEWCQNLLESNSGAVCLAGALYKGNDIDIQSVNLTEVLAECRPVFNKLHAAVGNLDPSFEHAPEFNDAIGRTKEEVLELLTSVAKDLRNSV